ncbi:hypothetical protein G6F46_014293 [Rhizopus delemar]|nr:hypothetical protein G6F46_014293 [Rhizopus delemar]
MPSRAVGTACVMCLATAPARKKVNTPAGGTTSSTTSKADRGEHHRAQQPHRGGHHDLFKQGGIAHASASLDAPRGRAGAADAWAAGSSVNRSYRSSSFSSRTTASGRSASVPRPPGCSASSASTSARVASISASSALPTGSGVHRYASSAPSSFNLLLVESSMLMRSM